MQIHELNTFAGTPGGGDFFAVDSGFDTAKISGDQLLGRKVDVPTEEGTPGQILRNKGGGATEWSDVGLPTDEQTEEAVSKWLNDHPEATTTVQDGSLTESKFSQDLINKAIKEYATPEMFGAVGDGTVDDTTAFQSALNSGLPVLASKTYRITGVTVKDCYLEITGTIIGQIVISNNATVTGGVIQQTTDDACIVLRSTLADGAGYMNSKLLNVKLEPPTTGVGIQLEANSNAMFGYYISDIDILSCDKSIYILNNNWMTKGDFNNIYCHSPKYAIYIENNVDRVAYCADMTFRNVFAQYDSGQPLNFVRVSNYATRILLDSCICYDNIAEYYYYIGDNAKTETRITFAGELLNDYKGAKFTNLPSVYNFYFTPHYSQNSPYIKVSTSNTPPIDNYGGLFFENFSSPSATGRFFGIIGRDGLNSGNSAPNSVFGISCYQGRLSLLRSVDGSVSSGLTYEVATPYSGNVYTTATLPSGTSVRNGATCWCSDIHMPVTFYNNTWYKPDGSAL